MMARRLTDSLTFVRQEQDTFFSDPCNDPDCPGCVYRNSMRMLIGSLVEAAQLGARCQEATAEIWGECDDPHCHFEQDMIRDLSGLVARIALAYRDARGSFSRWRTVPPDWDGVERQAMEEAIVMSSKLYNEGRRKSS